MRLESRGQRIIINDEYPRPDFGNGDVFAQGIGLTLAAGKYSVLRYALNGNVKTPSRRNNFAWLTVKVKDEER